MRTHHLRSSVTLLDSNSCLIAEWNTEKNGKLTPAMLTTGSRVKVWWKCEKGHEWRTSIKNRMAGTGCPYCAGKVPLIGVTDLKTLQPTLATEWNYEKNNGLRPEDVTERSSKKVWWKCNGGHEWQATIASRTRGARCPYCVGKKTVPGKTDLATINPKLAREWHPTKNPDIFPDQVKPFSNKKVWWKCEKGHEWQSIIAGRSKGNGCPYCSGRLAWREESEI